MPQPEEWCQAETVPRAGGRGDRQARELEGTTRGRPGRTTLVGEAALDASKKGDEKGT